MTPNQPTNNRAMRPDGRNLRAERNRQLVAQTFLQLLEEGVAQPTAQMIATKSGVSTSTIFRLYEDLEALHCAVLQSRFEQLEDLLVVDIPPDLPRAARINQLVDLRAQFFEKVAPVRRFLVSQKSSSVFSKGLAMNEHLFFDQLKELFVNEISNLINGKEILYSIDNLMSWENWERLRNIQGLSVNNAKGVTRTTLTQLLRV